MLIDLLYQRLWDRDQQLYLQIQTQIQNKFERIGVKFYHRNPNDNTEIILLGDKLRFVNQPSTNKFNWKEIGWSLQFYESVQLL